MIRSAAAKLLYRLRHPTWKTAGWALGAVLLLLLLFPLALVPFTPSVEDLKRAKTDTPARVLSADGKEIAAFRQINRDWVKLGQISPRVVEALIATEDHRFHQHGGIDLKRTAAAVLNTVGGDRQGGSTITQQLARNLFPEDIGRAPTMMRKLKEAVTALKIERSYSKEEILETYLNTVPFLYNAHGIEMAARTYFDRPASQLNVLQSATLIGMLKGTSYYNPVLNPERAVQRRNIVMAQMVKHQKLSKAEYEELKKAPLRVNFERQTESLGPAPHLTQQLRRWLIEWADRHSYNIYADGLVVHTTIDSRLQDMAVQAVGRHADRLQTSADSAWSPRVFQADKKLLQAMVRDSAAYKKARETGMSDDEAVRHVQSDPAALEQLRKDKTRLEAGFLALEPRSGQVRAWVGSRDFAIDQFDHVQQARRQPGSTFKPFVYGAAFEQGIRASETFIDQPVEIPLGPGGGVWRPTDVGAPSWMPMSLRDGLSYSKNTITAQLMQRVGPAAVATLARSMGVRQSKLEQVPSLALGTSPVTLREMVTAYSTLANDGRYVEPVLVTKVEDKNGMVLERFAPAPPEQAMSGAAAITLLDALRGAIDRGTGTAIRQRFGIQGDVAGKTGTTQDNTDGWFILMHPQLVAGAWVGFNDNRITMGDQWGPGARSALPMVGDFYQQAFKARLIDADMRFGTVPPEPLAAPVVGQEANAGAVSALFSGSAEPLITPPVEPEPAPPVAMPTPTPPVAVIPDPEPEPRPASPVGPPVVASPPIITITRPQPGAVASERGPRVFSVPAGVLAPGARPERSDGPGASSAPEAAEPPSTAPRPLTGRSELPDNPLPAPARGEGGMIEAPAVQQ